MLRVSNNWAPVKLLVTHFQAGGRNSWADGGRVASEAARLADLSRRWGLQAEEWGGGSDISSCLGAATGPWDAQNVG